jgi:signal transduction histidine kinase
MGGVRRALGRVAGSFTARPGVVDGVVAVVLTAAGLLNVSALRYTAPAEIAVGCCVLSTMSVAWRRRAPFLATVIAVTAGVAYRHVIHYQGGVCEASAILLDFYAFGRLRAGRADRLRLLALVAYFLAADTRFGGDGSISDLIQNGAPIALLPAVAGVVVARRGELSRQQAASAERLAVEQDLRVASAAAEERSHVARELHDVVAHSVSVMVIQAGAARLTVADEPSTASAAVRVVVAAGREALTDLRRIMGILRGDAGPDEGLRGIARLKSLIERACAGGLITQLVVEGTAVELPADVDLVVYRVVQEALTNALRHAGPARACVRVSFGLGAVLVEVSNTCVAGGGVAEDPAGSGQGLRGMRERVSRYGGTLQAGGRADGGYEVRARIPLNREDPGGLSSPAATPSRRPRLPRGSWWWRDEFLAAVLIIVLEGEVLVSPDRSGSLAVNAVLVAAMSLAAVFRRRCPLLFLIAVNFLALPLSGGLTAFSKVTLTECYVFAVPAYTVAAWSAGRRAVAGLAAAACVSLIPGLYWHASATYIAGCVLLSGAVWALGRITRSQRALAADVKNTTARLVAQREAREQLAVASERTRMAGDLHAFVARDVTAMVAQAEAVGDRMSDDPHAAIEALAAVERSGREALTQMRSILGILRARHDPAELDPSPGLDQVHALVQSARAAGRPVALTVTGKPGPLLGAVDVIAYRIIEEALIHAGDPDGGPLAIAVRFVPGSIELEFSGQDVSPARWPSPAITRRVMQCDGGILESTGEPGDPRMMIRLPRSLQASLA